jgi:hypothetical protein
MSYSEYRSHQYDLLLKLNLIHSISTSDAMLASGSAGSINLTHQSIRCSDRTDVEDYFNKLKDYEQLQQLHQIHLQTGLA